MSIRYRQTEAVVWGSSDLYSNMLIASKCFLNSLENSFGVPGLSFVTKQSQQGLWGKLSCICLKLKDLFGVYYIIKISKSILKIKESQRGLTFLERARDP